MKLQVLIRPERNLGTVAWFVAGLGAAAMYYGDPVSGRRRRRRARDLAVHFARTSSDATHKAATDFAHRTRGLFAAARRKLRHEEVADEILVERLRSRMGMLVSHPHALEVAVRDGTVTLSGPILAHEAGRLNRKLRRLRGVRHIYDRLERHASARDVPALQGGTPRHERSEFMQQNWAPAIRVIGGATGGGMIGIGLRAGGLGGGIVGGLGLALLARAVTNLPTKRLFGIGAGRRAIDLQKHIHIQAPPNEVFAFFRDVENFPKFMTHLKSVECRSDDGRSSHWVAAGPAGLSVSWDADLTRVEANKLIAWRSAPHSTIRNAGVVTFEADAAGGTHLHIRMSYNPPAGALGHAVAHLMGKDPKRAMDDDLLRLKALLEAGRATAKGRLVARHQVRV